MVYEFGREKKDDSVKIRMDITFELPEQMAQEVGTAWDL